MKRSLLGASSAVLALFAIVGCGSESDSDDGEQAQALLPLEELPPRPDLGPGESNWEPSAPGIQALDVSAEATCPSLSTSDLNSQSASDLVDTLLGTGPSAPAVSNVTFTGANIAAGTFSGGTDPIGFEEGVILSSGNIASVAGPNAQDGVTTNNGLGGDADLDGLIPGFTTLDATVLEFDFECPGAETLTFNYVFTSDEYNEFVNTAFNDVFGFFVNGSNVALIPGTSTPVAINNVNCGNPYSPPGGSNCDKFINNDLSDGGGGVCTEMDGLTTKFSVEAAINPGVNHIRLAIGDAGDQILDSNIFLEKGTFTCNSPPEAKCKDVTVPADGSCSADASINDGSSDPDGDEITCVQVPGAPYALGGTPVTLTCTDPFGESDSCQATITVEDVTAPAIECPSPAPAECINGGAVVSYADPTVSDNCGVASSGCEPPSGSVFDLGTTPAECSATDNAGNDSSCSFDVSVVDTLAPVVTKVKGLGKIWPPNHTMKTFNLDQCGVSINDQCQGVISLADASPLITCVTSDEVDDGFGDGDTGGDIVIVDNDTVQLRAEREDSANGRVYHINFEVTDAEGNVGEGTCDASIPGDQKGKGTAIDSGVHHSVGSCN